MSEPHPNLIPGVSPPDESIREGPPAENEHTPITRMGTRISFTDYEWKRHPIFDPKLMGYMIYSLELGDEKEKIHWQGYAEFYKRNLLQRETADIMQITKGKCLYSKGTCEENIKYCTKPKTHLLGPFIFGTPRLTKQGDRVDLKRLQDAIKEGRSYKDLSEDTAFRNSCFYYHRAVEKWIAMYPQKAPLRHDHPLDWHEELLQMINIKEPDPRSWTWICDPSSSNGKSDAVRWIEHLYETQVWKGTTNMHHFTGGWDNEAKVIIFDIPMEHEWDDGFYGLLESIKDGRLTSHKNFCQTKISKHIQEGIIFTNAKPKLTKRIGVFEKLYVLVNRKLVKCTYEELKNYFK